MEFWQDLSSSFPHFFNLVDGGTIIKYLKMFHKSKNPRIQESKGIVFNQDTS